MAIFNQELFTDKSDVVVSVGGWSLDVGQTVDAQAGNDTVNALKGGFSGDGTTNPGTGTDTLIVFGSGTFDGGDDNDKILFGEGTYVINGGTITSGGIDMNVSSFERIGGINGRLFGFSDGTIIVNADGFAELT